MGLVVALPLSAIAIVVYPFVTRTAPQEDLGDVPPRTIETVLFGVALGLLVTLTSVGAGAIGVTVLAALYPALPGKRLVGSDITPHASRGHLGLGNVDGSLLLALLCGSIPGILIGARLAGVVPERVLRPILAVTLCYAAYALYKYEGSTTSSHNRGSLIMLYAVIKALLSGVVIAAASEAAKRSPAIGAVILSLPLISILAFIWLWRDTSDTGAVAALSQSTFWFVLPTLPMFLVLPALLRNGAGFWPALGLSCLVTLLLYAAMAWTLGKLGISL
jgi:hypothetical protein